MLNTTILIYLTKLLSRERAQPPRGRHVIFRAGRAGHAPRLRD